jgi:hypothetical protein
MEPSLKSFLKDNDYRVYDRDATLIIRKSRVAALVVVFFFTLIGLAFLFFGWKWSLVPLFILGSLITFLPWLYIHLKGGVRHIRISLQGDEVALLKGWTRLTTLSKREIDSLHVFERVEQSHTSSFEEGNQDFVYAIYLRTTSGSDIKIMEIRSRQPQSEKVVELVKYLELVV